MVDISQEDEDMKTEEKSESSKGTELRVSTIARKLDDAQSSKVTQGKEASKVD